MNIDALISDKVKSIQPSPIRRFFDLANAMEGTVSLGIGEPDFVTPWHIREAAMGSLRAGETAWDAEVQDGLARAVFDAVFGLGRLQPLVDDPQVENIMIFGHDQVTVELTGGRQVMAAPVADSDKELVDFLSFVASRSEVNARPFSPSHP